MLCYIAEKCSDILVRKHIIQEGRKNVYIYGCELLVSTIACILFLLVLSLIFEYTELALIFLLFFMPIRIFSGGYHASSYRNCFILTNTIAILCANIGFFLAKKSGLILQSVCILFTFISILYIWINAPIESLKHSLNPTQKKRNRKFARMVLSINVAALLWMNKKAMNHMCYTAMVTIGIVMIMMMIAKRR